MPRTARMSAARPSRPLGSLTQVGAHRLPSCRSCGSARVTHIAMHLTDGSPVTFTSCQSCEYRSWRTVGGEALSTSTVLERTRKPA